jgi:glycosyltransferase involved in cell wall biosynthesis
VSSRTLEPLTVVIPCLDEAGSIGAVVQRLLASIDPARDRVLVVDNGSRDATADRAAAAGAEVVREPRRGYGYACHAGARGAPAGSVLLFLDGDGADDPDEVRRVLEPVLTGAAELSVGVRRHRAAGSMTPLQAAGNRVACLLVSAVAGGRVTDLGSMRAIRADRLRALGMQSRTYGWSTEMTVKALRAGYRYAEVPVRYHCRAAGESKVSGRLVASLRAGARITWTALRWCGWRPGGAVA